MREHNCLLLGGLWRFSPDPHADGETLGFWKLDKSAQFWREVPVPSCFEAGCRDIDFYQGICWYRRVFRLPSDWQSRRIVLRFEGVNYRARVWLNGEWLGENRDGFLPFEFEIQDMARWGEDNVLAVAVDNAHHKGDVPGMHVGWRGYGGILREVSLYATDFLYLAALNILAEPCAEGGRLECRLRIKNGSRQPRKGKYEVALYDTVGKTALLTLGPAAFTAAAGESADAVLEGTLPGVRSWSPSAPVLYRLAATLRDNSDSVDEVSVRVGFRRVEATSDGLRLNGKSIFLTGFNRHEDSPRTAMAADLETTRGDLEQMKEAGCNYVRLCHYPHHPAELDLCDELGLLAFCEIPLYFWNDADKEGRPADELRIQNAARQLERLIARDFNHASVIFWSVSNETPEDDPAVAEANRALIRRARELDPTRLCVHVSLWWTSHPNFDEDDVICINYYPCLDWSGKVGHTPGMDLTIVAEEWSRHLDTLRQRYPSKPVLITEFGSISFAGTHGNAFGEDEHARLIAATMPGIDKPFVCGATIWCWADHPWPTGHFMGGLSISPFGVLSRERRKLKPFWTARALFRAKQHQKLDADAASAANTSIIMLRPHLNDIPVVPFPAGYGIRSMTLEDIGLWTDIQRDAELYLKITESTFRDEFGDDLEAIKWRCFIITAPKGLGVGVVSAWYNRDFRGQDYGRIHWLAVRPSCQGKGLAKAALSYALRQLAQWHERCYLVTLGERLAAIRLYLNFGFEPDFTPPQAAALWQELGTRLQHPTLEKALAGAAAHGARN